MYRFYILKLGNKWGLVACGVIEDLSLAFCGISKKAIIFYIFMKI